MKARHFFILFIVVVVSALFLVEPLRRYLTDDGSQCNVPLSDPYSLIRYSDGNYSAIYDQSNYDHSLEVYGTRRWFLSDPQYHYWTSQSDIFKSKDSCLIKKMVVDYINYLHRNEFVIIK